MTARKYLTTSWMIGDHAFTPVVASIVSEAEVHRWDEKGGSLFVSPFGGSKGRKSERRRQFRGTAPTSVPS